MRLLKYFLGFCLLGFISFAAACYISPKIFVETAYALVKLEFDDLPEISSQSLYALSSDEDSDHIIVDVRTLEERQVSIIPGAIDETHFERNLSGYQNKKIIVYCTIGYRSGYYTQSLRQKGLDAYNLSAGILGWTHINGRLFNSQGKATKRVHIYSRPWDLALKNYIAVY
ncbi:rhodanese-related sulfurtransferase [Nitrosomonas aestuarii]|nr:rhodanese-related sulfurtransferase [Nitrosomonas aestuarii]